MSEFLDEWYYEGDFALLKEKIIRTCKFNKELVNVVFNDVDENWVKMLQNLTLVEIDYAKKCLKHYQQEVTEYVDYEEFEYCFARLRLCKMYLELKNAGKSKQEKRKIIHTLYEDLFNIKKEFYTHLEDDLLCIYYDFFLEVFGVDQYVVDYQCEKYINKKKKKQTLI